MADPATLYPMLVADIGGSNARFGIAAGRTDGPEGFEIVHQKTLQVASHTTFEGALAAFLAEAPVKPISCCVAAAGPTIGRTLQMSNAPWFLDADAIAARFGWQEVEVINDFVAMARACQFLGADDHDVLIKGKADPSKPRLILGPGTGFGCAALVPVPGRAPIVVSGESGHINLATVTREERQITNEIAGMVERVHVESVISGPGLARLHSARCLLAGNPAVVDHPKYVTAPAAEGDKDCLKSVEIFLGLFGSVVGDLAMVFGAKGGVYIGGGVMPRLDKLVPNSPFKERMLDKGFMRKYLDGIPVTMMDSMHLALRGAADHIESVVAAKD